MRILAVNGSPRGAKGNTEVLLQAFLKGAVSSGAQAETVYLKDKEIKHCRGCYTCWGKTPGRCVHKDDMADLLELRRCADVIVYATPLYVYTVSGLMKDFMDRSLPMAMPYIEKHGDRYVHPRRYQEKENQIEKMVLISNAGFPDRKYFSALSEMFRILGSSPNVDLVGMVLCSGGPLLTNPHLHEMVQWYIDACETAGRELVEAGHITAATQAVLDRDLTTDVDNYMSNVNKLWDAVLSGKVPFNL